MKVVKYVNLVANKLDSLFDILTVWDTVNNNNNNNLAKCFTVQK